MEIGRPVKNLAETVRALLTVKMHVHIFYMSLNFITEFADYSVQYCSLHGPTEKEKTLVN
jgi:hypothetical protein